jgi:hypothetical protein
MVILLEQQKKNNPIAISIDASQLMKFLKFSSSHSA